MADVGQRDRSPQLLELNKTPWPAPPLNLFMADATRGTVDLRWDDPSILTLNRGFQLLGVNVYRSFDSEFGPFTRITDLPLGATFWRDQTDNVLVEEDVSGQYVLFGVNNSASGAQETPRYLFKTQHPIVREGSQSVPASSPRDVRVFIDGREAKVLRVNGPAGEVEIDPNIYTDTGTQSRIDPILPTTQSRTICYYRYTRSLLKSDLNQRIFYRVTSVGLAKGCNPSQATAADLVETPLEHAAATNTFEVEKLDYIWREAIRRNRWILGQGGERVQVFLRKNVGIRCGCFASTHNRPLADCPICYGTAIVGGYEGPYPIIIAPDDSEVKVAQRDMGQTVEHTYEVWTGPTPLLSHRDFVMKINGDRYTVGPVRMPSNRGNLLQQHFTISSFDEKDIRYKVPVDSPVRFTHSQFVPSGPETEASSDITDKTNIGAERQLRGRTLAWKNSNY